MKYSVIFCRFCGLFEKRLHITGKTLTAMLCITSMTGVSSWATALNRPTSVSLVILDNKTI
jgi:hypothetical protein